MKLSKKHLLLMLIFIIPVVYAEVNTNKASDWLANFTKFDQDVETISLSVLALSLSDNPGAAQQGLAKLMDRQDPAGCWPKGSCRVKDTSIAMLAASHFNRPTATARSWLISSRLPASSTGKFWIQIAAPVDGQCRVSYDGKSKTFTLKNGNIAECGNKPWIESSCIDVNLLKGSFEKKVDVDCSNLQGNSIISLIFQQGDSYYILQEEHTNFAKLTISNACLGTTKSSTSCDYDSTLFATFAMRAAGQQIGTQTYLESNVQSTNIIGYSLLYAITKKPIYQDILASKQLGSGSFTNVYQTGMSLIALAGTPTGTNASNWLESQQSSDGSFNRNVRDTSAVIYGSLFQPFSDASNTCSGQGYQCCNACSSDGEDYGSLDSSCRQGEVCCSECQAVVLQTCSELGGEECSFNEECFQGSMQESQNALNCCVGGTCRPETTSTSTILPTCNYDDVCDFDETADSCPDDCGQSWSWLIYLVILLLIGGGIFYLYKTKPDLFKFKKKEKYEPMPTQRPAYPVTRPGVRQQVTQQPARQPVRTKAMKTKIEKELEKSLEEAKKLLKEDKK